VKLKILLIEFVAAIFGAGFAGLLLGSMFGLASELPFGGDKATVFLIVFLGFPAGSTLAIVSIDKLLFGMKLANRTGVVLGFFLSCLGGIETIVILDKAGSKGIFLAPLIAAILALAGYSIPLTRRFDKRYKKSLLSKNGFEN
jgi:hypothetical protein